MGLFGATILFLQLRFLQLESIYRATPSVQNACIFASSQHQRPIAIIIPSEPALKSLAQALNVPDSDALHNKDVRARILKELQATGRKAGLSSMEIVSGVVAVDEEWTPANVSSS
jgi:long-chain acyl-CoA synthetase